MNQKKKQINNYNNTFSINNHNKKFKNNKNINNDLNI